MAGGLEKRADLVVFDADLVKVYRRLIDSIAISGRIEGSISSLSIRWGYLFGISERADLYPEVKHHTIIMGETFKDLLEDL